CTGLASYRTHRHDRDSRIDRAHRRSGSGSGSGTDTGTTSRHGPAGDRTTGDRATAHRTAAHRTDPGRGARHPTGWRRIHPPVPATATTTAGLRRRGVITPSAVAHRGLRLRPGIELRPAPEPHAYPDPDPGTDTDPDTDARRGLDPEPVTMPVPVSGHGRQP